MSKNLRERSLRVHRWLGLEVAILVAISLAPVVTAGAKEKPLMAPTLPATVEAEIKQTKSECDAERSSTNPGFVTEKDINGDGVKDYILDYGQFECGDGSSIYCGSAGCLTQIFVSMPDGSYIKVLNENVRGLKFTKSNRRPAMIIDLHGTVCGRAGAAPCSMTLFWNGQGFSPAK